MNYLAHFHLADAVATATNQPAEALLIGGLLGDFVKGPLRGELPTDWETGIRLHRRIDALTDRHPLSQDCLGLLPTDYRRYGGIMLDLCFDYCLSRHWQRFHAASLSDFTAASYRQLLNQRQAYPRAAARQIQALARYDVLANMQDWQQLTAMLARIGQRLRRDNPLAECTPVLQAQLPEIEARFLQLYPALLSQLQEEFKP